MRPILVSSCLLGLKTRYDGTDNYSQAVVDFIKNNQLTPIPVCPEQLAGLSTPRPKCWFSIGDGDSVLDASGKLIDEHGEDLTSVFLHGARECLKIVEMTNCKHAILQQRSPSCGSQSIYLNEKLVQGVGITTAMLKKSGIKVFSDDNLPAKKT
ncbi:DUF523 domain-containing protein [uncultured Desulfuromusa sp.]|uniref:DUF523 domain-containing protein n=1 Tax=uncultured Desulfuromusa sp. TaxID=219183 RepID=UPI002AA72E8C|nr:DUF523 domain-containing protein [uncultured Desulfuromusa sp.]